MAQKIERFRVEGLHNTRTVEVVFEDNKLVLVGENGTGKSTIANLLCNFLTGQFGRMTDFQFETATVWISGKEILVRRKWLSDWGMPPRGRIELIRKIQRFGAERLRRDPRAKKQFSAQCDVPLGLITQILKEIDEHEQLLLPQSEIEQVEQDLKEAFQARVMFLPTYRRIELDFLEMFPNLGRQRKMELLEQLRYRDRDSDPSYIELVEFGMRDVQELITSKMATLRDGLTTALTNLMGAYLKEVIAGEHHSVKAEEILELRDDEVEAMFKRLDESIVGTAEQERLRETIATIKKNRKITQKNRVVAHFLTRMVKLHRDRQRAERQVKDYVDVCNGYLNNKALRYDNIDSSLGLVQTDDSKGEALEFAALSSGEKQIVSLFTHICLSDENCFLVIDEPELSLSVAWQKKFLPDIVRTGRCEGIFAVTHSPFIFENELEPYTRSVEEFFQFSSEESQR